MSCYCYCTALPCLPSIVVSSLPNLPGSTSSRSVARFVSRQPPFNLLHWVLALPCLVGISAYLVARSCLFRRLSPGPVDASLIPAALPTSRLFVCKACQTTSSYQTELYFSILYITLPYLTLPCLALQLQRHLQLAQTPTNGIGIFPHTLPLPQSIKTSGPPLVVIETRSHQRLPQLLTRPLPILFYFNSCPLHPTVQQQPYSLPLHRSVSI